MACGKRGESLEETKFRRCVTEPEAVGEASCAGKLPQSPVAVAMCISFECQQSTKHRPAAQFTSTLPSIRPTLGTLRHRTPYYSSLVKTFRSRTTTRDYSPTHSIPRRPLVSRRAVQCNCPLCAAPIQSKGAFQHLHPIHSTAQYSHPIPCRRSLGTPPVSAR